MRIQRSILGMICSLALLVAIGANAKSGEDRGCDLNSDPRYFESGTWNGVYRYEDGKQVDQTMELKLKDGTFTGSGSDLEVGKFTIAGTFNHATGKVNFTKTYPTHSVAYQAELKEGHMEGQWNLPGLSGKFHLLMSCHGPSQPSSPKPTQKSSPASGVLP